MRTRLSRAPHTRGCTLDGVLLMDVVSYDASRGHKRSAAARLRAKRAVLVTPDEAFGSPPPKAAGGLSMSMKPEAPYTAGCHDSLARIIDSGTRRCRVYVTCGAVMFTLVSVAWCGGSSWAYALVSVRLFAGVL